MGLSRQQVARQRATVVGYGFQVIHAYTELLQSRYNANQRSRCQHREILLEALLWVLEPLGNEVPMCVGYVSTKSTNDFGYGMLRNVLLVTSGYTSLAHDFKSLLASVVVAAR